MAGAAGVEGCGRRAVVAGPCVVPGERVGGGFGAWVCGGVWVLALAAHGACEVVEVL